MDITELSTLGGILALTAVLTQLAKSWCSAMPYVKRVPIFVVAIIIAMTLTALSFWAGLTPGPLHVIIAKTVLAALGSSGLFSAVTGKSMQTIKETQDTKPITSDEFQKVYTSDSGAGLLPPTGRGSSNTPDVKLWLGLLAMLTLSLNQGCTAIQEMMNPSQTPANKIYAAKELYGTLLNTLADLRDQGLISEVTNAKITPSRKAANDALKLWQVAITTGNSTDAQKWEQAFNAASLVIQAWVTSTAPVPTSQPTTKPVGKLSGVKYEHSDYPSIAIGWSTSYRFGIKIL